MSLVFSFPIQVAFLDLSEHLLTHPREPVVPSEAFKDNLRSYVSLE